MRTEFEKHITHIERWDAPAGSGCATPRAPSLCSRIKAFFAQLRTPAPEAEALSSQELRARIGTQAQQHKTLEDQAQQLELQAQQLEETDALHNADQAQDLRDRAQALQTQARQLWAQEPTLTARAQRLEEQAAPTEGTSLLGSRGQSLCARILAAVKRLLTPAPMEPISWRTATQEPGQDACLYAAVSDTARRKDEDRMTGFEDVPLYPKTEAPLPQRRSFRERFTAFFSRRSG
jgi:hypothetical protein